MRNRAILAVALVTSGLVPSAASAREAPAHPFGFGLVVGEPTGLTAKLYLSQPFALQFGAGFVDNFDGEDGFHMNVDVLWHPAVLARSADITLPFYIGVGGRLFDHSYDYVAMGTRYVDHDTRVGVRVPFGLLMDFNKVPLDLYFELALVVDLIYFNETIGPFDNRDRAGFQGGIGLRYYF